MAAERFNHRSIAVGVAGSIAVLLIAAVSLGIGRARAETVPATLAGHVSPAASAKAIPAAASKPKAEWLRKLLSRSDLSIVEGSGRRS